MTSEKVKAFILLTRRDDLDREEFNSHWLNVHGPLASRLKNLRRYVQSHVLSTTLPGFPVMNPYSGIAEVWFDTLGDAQGIPDDPDYLNGLYLDEPNFLIREKTEYIFTTEHQLIETPVQELTEDAGIKSMFLTRRKPDLTVEEFQSHWREKHAKLIPGTPGLLGYSQCHVLPSLYKNENPPYDGVAELWWPDLDTFMKAWHSKEHMDTQFEDLQRFIDLENTVGMLVKPYRLI